MCLTTGCESAKVTTKSESSFDRLASVSVTAKSPQEPVQEVKSTTPVRVSQSESFRQADTYTDFRVTSPMDLAVRLGTATRAGPITPEKFARWKAHEEMKIEVDIQLGRVRHHERALRLVENREQQFLDDIDRELRAYGGTIEGRLRTFDRLRTKYSEELRLARNEAGQLQESLLAWECQYLNPQHFDPFEEGMNSMQKKLLEEIVSPQQMTTLATHNIKDSRTLALTFWSQPEQLALLLEVDLVEATRIVREAAVAHVSKAEIDELEAIADRVRRIPPGVLPPGQKEEQP
tara:strand:+ start:6661 stop:7533 length:873 start_codon:yes stop_codon:yes gene_type:complete